VRLIVPGFSHPDFHGEIIAELELGASSRSQAVLRSRDLGLLDR
jgi:hypothetical protein